MSGNSWSPCHGIAHVILKEGLEDREFLSEWCHGVSDYEEIIKEFTPERTADITGIDKELIIKAALLWVLINLRKYHFHRSQPFIIATPVRTTLRLFY